MPQRSNLPTSHWLKPVVYSKPELRAENTLNLLGSQEEKLICGMLKQKEWDSSQLDPGKRKEYLRIKQRIEKRFNNWMDDLGEQGQARMIRMADKILESIEQNALTLKQNEDGTYTAIKDQS